MSYEIIGAASMVAASLPIAWWAVSGTRVSRTSAETLQRGFGPALDVRRITLEQSARQRAFEPAIAALASRARRMTPAGMLDRLQQRLASAGMQGRVTIEQVLALKLAFAAVASLWTLLRFAAAPSLMNVVLAGVLVGLGWFGPDAVIYSRAEERKKRVRRELADTMDQITIAVEAGLGFEAALARVAQSSRGILGEELSRTLQDIQLGVPRAEALDAMSERTDVAELRHFVSAIRQAERYGLPIATVLRVQASELRDKRRQAAEEHAMKIPVKVLFPLVLFILPTLFIVILGPGVIQIIDGFSQQ